MFQGSIWKAIGALFMLFGLIVISYFPFDDTKDPLQLIFVTIFWATFTIVYFCHNGEKK